MEEPFVILVDKNDNVTGLAGKTEAHIKALLHRAVSVFIINTKGEWLLQQRAYSKYHSAGKWSNACCTHPFPGETNENACHRRLKEEMGLAEVSLKEAFSFIYKEPLENGLTEHELDHVFLGISDDPPVINRSEVSDYRYIPFSRLDDEIKHQPENFTVWFRMIYSRVNDFMNNTSRESGPFD